VLALPFLLSREYYKEKGSLIQALWKIAAPSFLPAGFWEFCYVISRVSLPLSLRELLLVVQENPGESIIRKGLPYAITLTLAALFSALSQNRVVFLSTKSGICIRAALTSAIYEHALQLTPAGRQGLTSGEVTNLVAVDTQKLFDVMLEGHNLWSCPLLIILVSVLLWVIMGPELTVGVGVLIIFVPVVQQMVSRMLRIRKARSILTDTRINILASMLQGIRVAKLNHYESKISEHVGAVREQEMKLLRSELFMWGWVLTSAVCSPLLALVASFSFFALADESNLITPANAFSALLLFGILRFPINMTARLVGKMAQALEAASRVSKFLAREIRTPETLHKSSSESGLDQNDEKVVLELKNGCFSINPEEELLRLSRHSSKANLENGPLEMGPLEEGTVEDGDEEETAPSAPLSFALRDISLRIKKSEVVAVVGKVGSGKTLLLRALLGEVPPKSSSSTALSISGTLSYAAQEPFVLNTSLRNNIIFGSAFNEDRYEKVIDACCLRPDMQRLGPAGDLTQIGERGVTLSGGKSFRQGRIAAVPDTVPLTIMFSLTVIQAKNSALHLLGRSTQTLMSLYWTTSSRRLTQILRAWYLTACLDPTEMVCCVRAGQFLSPTPCNFCLE
jgi:ABC-type multidrug transport system fused ATPase/permease subunit